MDIEPDVVSNSYFKKHINQLVWSMNIEPSKFEFKEIKWLDDMFHMRDKWIPSYFRDIPMCGLMKTTYRSESSNSFFNVFSGPTNLLVNFMFNFDTALSKQHTSPQLLFALDPLKIEKHASLVYTREAFIKVQKQIKKASYQCFQKTSIIVNGFQEYTIIYKEIKSDKIPEFKFYNYICLIKYYYYLSMHMSKQLIVNVFISNFFGILCSHAFRVLIDYNIFKIPDKYILDRWRKNKMDVGFQKVNQRWRVCNTNISNLLQDKTPEST
uniref:Protein FAR1-RELATED SEQUENCE n=1 Tax=Lactuca sativa TaxID=4236 RepID=A0A9R1V2Z0_LACSA|nr:hypothetical protein LSAT_V11C700376370 [Lactuca sativa]